MTKRAGVMLCYPFEERRLRNEIRGQARWNPPYLIQPKLDGERCRALVLDTGVTLLSSEQHVITSVPHINSAIWNLHLPIGMELDGELYQHGEDFSEIHSRVGRTASLHLDYESISYHIFDIIDEQACQADRIKYLNRLPLASPLVRVPTDVAVDVEEVLYWLESFTDHEYEGIIIRELNAPYIRRRSPLIMKFKPKKSDYYQIIDYKEEISKDGVPKNTLGALFCTSDEGTVFSVGSGFTADQRQHYWKHREELIAKVCHIQYQNITTNGVPRFPVFVEILDPLKGGDSFA